MLEDIWAWMSKAGKSVVDAITGREMADNILPTPIVVKDSATGETELVWAPKEFKVPIVSDFVTATEGAIKGVGSTLKNLPLYFLVALLFLGAYLILMGRKGKAIA